MNTKEKIFYAITFLFSFLCIFSVIFSQISKNAYKEFSFAAVGFFMAIFMMFEIKNAFKPLKKISRSNPIKGMYHIIGKPKGYRNLCYVLFAIFSILGICTFIIGLLRID